MISTFVPSVPLSGGSRRFSETAESSANSFAEYENLGMDAFGLGTGAQNPLGGSGFGLLSTTAVNIATHQAAAAMPLPVDMLEDLSSSSSSSWSSSSSSCDDGFAAFEGFELCMQMYAALLEKKTRKRRRFLHELRALYPKQSVWWLLYVHPRIGVLYNPDGPKAKDFKSAFIVTRTMFLAIVAEFRAQNYIPRGDFDALGRESSPLELLILGSLGILGGSLQHSRLFDSTLISRHVHYVFFKDFVQVMKNVWYPRHVRLPTSVELQLWSKTYARAGLPGVIASVDGVHVPLSQCPENMKLLCSSRYGYHTLAYLVVGDTMGRIWHVSGGYPGSYNDPAMLQEDPVLQAILNGLLVSDHVWELLDEDGNSRWMKGALILSDNGFSNFARVLKPIKITPSRKATAWSEWIESMRKDIERIFGQLKRHCDMLKDGYRFKSFTTNDNIFYTICALHNLVRDTEASENGYWSHLATNEGGGGNAPPPAAVDAYPTQVYSDVAYNAHRNLWIEHFHAAVSDGRVFWPQRKGEVGYNKYNREKNQGRNFG
jgi:hypothetical protein